MVKAMSPPSLLFFLRYSNTGTYKLWDCVKEMVACRRAHANEYLSILMLLVSLSLEWPRATPYLHMWPSNTRRWFWPSCLCSHCLFPASWCTLYPYVSFKSGGPLSPSPLEFLQSNPTDLQNQIQGLFLPLPDPQTGKPDMGLNTFTPMEEFLWYNYFSVCGLLIWHIMALILSWFYPSYCFSVAPPLSLYVRYLFW